MDKLKTYFFEKKVGNFGDELNKYIPELLFNVFVEKCSVKDCNYAFIGSILDPFLGKELYSDIPVKIWGSGFLREPGITATSFIRKLEISAVRGKFTKHYLEKILNKELNNLPLGDPGLLISKAFTNLDFTKRYEYGIIPHYVDENDKNLNKIKLSNSIVIPTSTPVLEFIEKLVSCEKIISSAMHGLIAADAFQIPNCRFIASYNLVGGEFKFNDYYSAFDEETHPIIDLREITELTRVETFHIVNKNKLAEIQSNLIESFPYKCQK